MYLVFFKMLGNVSSQFVHIENKSCLLEQLSWLCLLSEVTFGAILGTANQLGKCNDELKLQIKIYQNEIEEKNTKALCSLLG